MSRALDAFAATTGEGALPWTRPPASRLRVIYLRGLRVATTMVVFALAAGRPVRVGDGSEYYALFLAWRAGGRPFMTDAAWAAYETLYAGRSVDGLIAPHDLVLAFPGLVRGATADFNHFWFYSGAAAALSRLAAVVGFELEPHRAFLLLHLVLLIALVELSWRTYRTAGVLAVAVLTLASPALWFIDKVHTEFFTFCLTTSAVIYFSRRRYANACLALALASTQNPSFGAVAVVVAIIAASYRCAGGGLRRGDLRSAPVWMLAALVSAAHPAYYFARHGTLTPQFLTGGARFAEHWRLSWIWLLDLDVGLLPNWWPGVVLAGFGIATALARRNVGAPFRTAAGAFLLAYVCASLLAQSSTHNLNCGGTPGLARYAVWYLALFFQGLLAFASWIRSSLKACFLGTLGLALAALHAHACFRPSLTEAGWTAPSFVSRVLQTHAARLYDSPAEIFAERFSGVGESAALNEALAVVGPDCSKALILHAGASRVFAPPECQFDNERLAATLRGRGVGSEKWLPSYVHLSEVERAESAFAAPDGEWVATTTGSKTLSWRGDGFSDVEDWGTWTDGGHATLFLPCASLNGDARLELDVVPFVGADHLSVSAAVVRSGETLWRGDVAGPSIIVGDLRANECDGPAAAIDIVIANPDVPARRELSDDRRHLGLALRRYRLRRLRH